MEITANEIYYHLQNNGYCINLNKRKLTDALQIAIAATNPNIELTEFTFTQPVHLIIRGMPSCRINFSGSTFENLIDIVIHRSKSCGN